MVPVLSVNNMFRLPEVSIPTGLRTSTWSLSMRRMLRESTTVIIIGSPSGTATTTTVIARVIACSTWPNTTEGWENCPAITVQLNP